MPVVNGYVMLEELKDWVTLSDGLDDVKLERAITAASRGIDNYCRRHFWQFVGARRFDACDRWWLNVGDLVSITSLKADEDGDGTFEATWAASDYELLPINPAAGPEPEPYHQVHAVGSRTFPLRSGSNGRHGLVEVTGTFGWPEVPESVRQACLLVATRVVKRKDSPEGVSGFDEFGVIRISSRDDPDAVRFLDPYWDASQVGV